MTYAMFEALLERHRERERREYIHTSMIVATIMNFSTCHPDESVPMLKFVPPGEDEKEEDLTKLPPEEQARRMMNQFSKRSFSR